MSPPGAVDVDLDSLVGVLGLEEQQLRADEVGDGVIDGRAQEDDVLAEQARVEVAADALTSAFLTPADRRIRDVVLG